MIITELTDAAAALIAELPDEASDLTSRQLDAMAELLEEIADRLELSETRIDAMLELTSQRGYQGAGQPLDYLTSDERATFEDGESRGLDATLAHHALARWGDHSGWSKWLERREAKQPRPNAKVEAGTPDGTPVNARAIRRTRTRQPATNREP